MADPYVTLAEVRAEGVGSGISDDQIDAAILVWQSFIDRATRQWFSPKSLEFAVDGNGGDTLFLGVPIISIDELRINGSSAPVAPDDYRIYLATGYPQGKDNPRISLLSARFLPGKQNQRIRGVFGCVDENGEAPPLIKRALVKLVVEKIAASHAGSVAGVIPPLLAGIVTEERTDGHSVKYGPPAFAPRALGLSGVTADVEILAILKLYRAPIGIASTARR